MYTPRLGKNSGILGKVVPFYEIEEAGKSFLINLYFSEFLLYLGLVLILLNNLNVIAPGSYFGAFNWVTIAVFYIGLVINFVSIPCLYISSFRNFKKGNDFWEKETFWILPLFFFGTFFVYCSQIDISFIMFIITMFIVGVMHFKFVHASQRLIEKDSEENMLVIHYQYNLSLKYLTAYYILLLALLIFWNPTQQVFVWIRLHL